MAKKTKIEATIPDINELANDLKDTINKKFKADGQKAFYLDGTEETPIDLDWWVSTGCVGLDLAISNRPNAGLAYGRIVELTGLEQSGKSLIAAEIIRETQQQGGIGVFIDTEAAQTSDWMVALGVNVSQLLYITVDKIEDAFTSIETIINRIREKGRNVPITIVLDSVAGASTESELASGFKKTGYNTDKAIIMSESMRKITNLIAREKVLVIFTNQVRQKLDAVAFGEKWVSPGGKALNFHASVGIRLQKVGTIKSNDSLKVPIGIRVKAKIVKNRLGPPLREVTYDIYFDRGIDNISSVYDLANALNVIKGGSWKSWVNKDTGEEIKFQGKEGFAEMLWNVEEHRIPFYENLCNAYITVYQTQKIAPEEVNVDTTDE